MRIGIDLGGTSVKAALCEEDGTLLGKRSTPTRTGDAEGLCADMKLLALALCGERGISPDRITSIGIGVPGVRQKDVYAQIRHQSRHEQCLLCGCVQTRVWLRGAAG